MNLAGLLLLIQGTLALRPTRIPITRRSAAATFAALAGAAVQRAAVADYGEGANQKMPAFLPSPIRPTGRMAETCEVVALGRDDVCLEPKKLLTSYDSLQLDKAAAALDEQIEYGDARLKLQPYLKAVRALVPLAKSSDFDALATSAPTLSEMCDFLDGAAAGVQKQSERAKRVRKAAASLASACRARDGSPAARAVLLVANGLVEFADA